MDLALRIGELLLSSGAGAGDVSAAMNNVARACGLRRFTADVMFTELTMSVQTSPEAPAVIQIRQVRYREVDYGDLTLVDHLIRQLVAGVIDREYATSRLNRIISSGHSRPRWAVSLALGVMGGGVGLLLGGDWLVVLLAAVAAMLVDLMQRQMGRRRLPGFYQQVAGGLLATLIAVGVAATPAEVSPSLVISTNIVMLLAGVNFLGAIQDALTGFPLTAGARVLEAFLATAGIVAGVSGGLQVADVLGIDLGDVDPGAYSIADVPVMVIGGAIAASAYAYSAYAPGRALLPIAAVAALSVGLYAVVYERGVGIAWSSALAALLLGLVSYPVRRPRSRAVAGGGGGLHHALPAGPVDLPRTGAGCHRRQCRAARDGHCGRDRHRPELRRAPRRVPRAAHPARGSPPGGQARRPAHGRSSHGARCARRTPPARTREVP